MTDSSGNNYDTREIENVFGDLFLSMRTLGGGNTPIDADVRVEVSRNHPTSTLVNNLSSFMMNRSNLFRRMNIGYSDVVGGPLHNFRLQGTPLGNILRQSMDDIGGTKKIASDEMLKSVQDTSECEDLTNEDECPICMDGFDDKGGIRITCKHAFHKECIVEWLQGDNRCPVCRCEYPHKEISLARSPAEDGGDNEDESDEIEDDGDDIEDDGDDIEDDGDDIEDDEPDGVSLTEVLNRVRRDAPHRILQTWLPQAMFDRFGDEIQEQRLIQQAIFESIQGLPPTTDTHDISGSNDTID